MRAAGRSLSAPPAAAGTKKRGVPAQRLVPGSVAIIPAGVKHWHGAQADSWFSHIALKVPGKNCSNEWLEPVGDDAYAKIEAS